MNRLVRMVTVIVMSVAALAAPGAAAAASEPIGVLAWECPAGNVCVYTGTYGAGSRCNWSEADPNWHSGNIRCSWAAGQPVRSIYNRGQSPSFLGVILNTGINNQGLWDCVKQGGWRENVNVFLGSHYWTSGFPYCY
jgi:hypothetical protein